LVEFVAAIALGPLLTAWDYSELVMKAMKLTP
jgi:hypothetical protein